MNDDENVIDLAQKVPGDSIIECKLLRNPITNKLYVLIQDLDWSVLNQVLSDKNREIDVDDPSSTLSLLGEFLKEGFDNICIEVRKMKNEDT